VRFHAPPPRLPGSYLVLELSGSCNLACVHCDRPRPPGEAQGEADQAFLDPRLLDGLLQDLARADAHFDALILFWLGEPLLHPRFVEIYQSLLRANQRSRIFEKLELHTNATCLDDSIMRAALNRSDTPQVWHLSIDAARASTYRKIKGRDRFAAVERAVGRMVARKGRLGATWPRLVFQFILCDRNIDEAAPFRHHWRQACRRAGLELRTAAGHVPDGPGDEAVVFFRQLDCPTAEEQARQNRIFRTAVASMGLSPPAEGVSPEQVEPRNLQPCSAFWKSPVIGWRGDVTVCTRDSGFAMVLGNIRDRPFSELWWGAEQRARRARVARGDYQQLPLCQDCFIPRSANYTQVGPLEIQRCAQWERGLVGAPASPQGEAP